MTRLGTVPSVHAGLREPAAESQVRAQIRAGAYDFIDFGSSAGGSIDYCTRRFTARRGIGIDLGAEEVEQIRAKGFDAIQGDVLSFDCPAESFRFVSMMDFLEHLPDAQSVEQALATARRIARDFLFIRHPSFEDEHYLNAIELKQYWTDWSGHTAKITVAQFMEMFERLGLHQCFMRFRQPSHRSSDDVILPLTAPRDQHHYDRALHGPKPEVAFSRPLFGQIDLFVALRQLSTGEWSRICAPWD